VSVIQTILHSVEEGKARFLVRLIPLAVTLLVITGMYDFSIYRGLNDAQSMDNAQLARQIYRGKGFTTEFIRPYAIDQFRHKGALENGVHEKTIDLFPGTLFPANAPRVLPDTYNAPGYPYLLAVWFHLVHPTLTEPVQLIAARHVYSGDRVIPWLNQIFLLLTAFLIFLLGRRLFDLRVAWLALAAWLFSDLAWRYSITALSTCFLTFLFTCVLFVAVEIFAAGESSPESEPPPLWPIWVGTLGLAFVLGLTCLTRLHLLILLAPLGLFLGFLPRSHFLLVPSFILVVVAMVTPWFWHMYQISGSPLGSNGPLLHYGTDPFKGNTIYCTLGASASEQLFRNASQKEYSGFAWNLEHAWELLGSNPLVLLFAVSILHHFRRARAQAFRWLILGSAFCIVAATNLCVDDPEAVGPWNTLMVLLPAMLVVGSAFFFILLDRLQLNFALFNGAVIVVLLGLTALPLLVSLSTRSGKIFNYPPYLPPYLKYLSNVVPPSQWITSDLPWATAWYGDHASLWLPDKIGDFKDLQENVCPSAMLVLTPVTLNSPASDLLTGEFKDWFPFITGLNIPPDFPLSVHPPMQPGGAEYFIWIEPGHLK
jgi:hypothetical protein